MKGFVLGIVAVVFAACLAAMPKAFADESEIQRCRGYIAANAGQSDVNLAATYHRLGMPHFQCGDKDTAAECFSAALSLAATPQTCAVISLDYARLLLEFSRNTDGVRSGAKQAELIVKQALIRASENDPQRDELQAMLALCLVCQDRIIEAKRLYRLTYNETETNQHIASIYREQGRFDEAKYFEGKIPTPRAIALAAGNYTLQSLPRASVIPSKTSNLPSVAGVTVIVGGSYRTASANDRPKRNLHYISSIR